MAGQGPEVDSGPRGERPLLTTHFALKVVRSSKRGMMGSELNVSKIALSVVWKRDCDRARLEEGNCKEAVAVIQSFSDLCINRGAGKQTDSEVIQQADPTNGGADRMCS